MHIIVAQRKPRWILNHLRMLRSRMKGKIAAKYKSQNEKYQSNLIIKSLKLYNEIPDDIKELQRKKFHQKMMNIKIED